MVCYVGAMVVLSFQGWGMNVNCITIVSDGSAMVVLLFQGWGIVLELAAILWRNPKPRVGLAASKPDFTVGLAASFGQLTGYIWIWQNNLG
jgi:hypothetical protein